MRSRLIRDLAKTRKKEHKNQSVRRKHTIGRTLARASKGSQVDDKRAFWNVKLQERSWRKPWGMG